jgi:hypothetical protein
MQIVHQKKHCDACLLLNADRLSEMSKAQVSEKATK